MYALVCIFWDDMFDCVIEGVQLISTSLDKDQEQFTRQLLYYLGGFAVGIPVSILLRSCRYCSMSHILKAVNKF